MIIPTTRAFITIITRGAKKESGNKSMLSSLLKCVKKRVERNVLQPHPLIRSRLRRPHRRPGQIGGEERGYDAGKCIKGRKRFILVDTMGLLLAVKVVAASVSEKAGAKLLIEKIWAKRILKELCGKLELVWVDAGYQGDDLYDWVANLTGWLWQVVKRSDKLTGFVLLPRRWVVERSFAWLSFNRRLSKDYEKLTRNSESTLYISLLPMMLRRLK